MKIREKTIKEINKLEANKLLTLYDIILSMKSSEKDTRKVRMSTAYLKVRESLKNIKDSLSYDVILMREDRNC